MVAQVRRNDGLLLGSTQQGLISRGTHTHTQMQVTLDHRSFVALYSFLACRRSADCDHLVHRYHENQWSNEVIWGNYMGATRLRLWRVKGIQHDGTYLQDDWFVVKLE